MLVAPIIPFNGSDAVAKNPTNGTGNASRTVWVPPGQWQDGWSGAVVTGPKNIQVKDCPLDQIPMWHRKGSVLVTTAPGGSTSEQDWDALSAEVFPFALKRTLKPGATLARDAASKQRTATSFLYDTKASTANPPRTVRVSRQEHACATVKAHTHTHTHAVTHANDTFTPSGLTCTPANPQALTLEQHATGGAAALRIGRGPLSRHWLVRVHLLAGETINAMHVQGVRVPFTRVYDASDAASATNTSGGSETVGAMITPGPHALGGGSIVEASVPSLPDQEQLVRFVVAKK